MLLSCQQVAIPALRSCGAATKNSPDGEFLVTFCRHLSSGGLGPRFRWDDRQCEAQVFDQKPKIRDGRAGGALADHPEAEKKVSRP